MTDAQTGVDIAKWLATNYGFSGLVAVAALVAIGYLTKAMLGIITRQADHWPAAITHLTSTVDALRLELARAEAARLVQHNDLVRSLEKR